MTADKPLADVRVLDLTNVLAGPFCCHQLAYLGADVIKVEAPGRGDLARQLGVDAELCDKNMGISFLAQNSGKKSVTLNLKSAEGKKLLKRMVAKSDVLVENFRPGVMKRLAIDYETLKESNPNLIYCAISGFGQDGPWAGRPAYDQIIQGLSGVMSVTGKPGEDPLRVGYPVADTIGGMTAAFAISAALHATPRGSFIDVSMLEAVIATMGWAVSSFLIGGVAPAAHGNENMVSAPSGAFRTGDGLINIAANKHEQWAALVRHLNRADLLEQPEYATRQDRIANRDALQSELETALAAKSSPVWARELNALGVPSGAVLTVPEVLAHPQVAERGLMGQFADVPGVGRDIEMVGTAMKIDGQAPHVSEPPAQLGQHNAEIYGSLGISTDDLARMKREGVI
ncbi:MAG: CaiB/BaiF CoA-transferase family protein [Stappiaceae bacterium]